MFTSIPTVTVTDIGRNLQQSQNEGTKSMEPAPGTGLGVGVSATLARPKRANIRTTAYAAATVEV
jgi:hypothetical protein